MRRDMQAAEGGRRRDPEHAAHGRGSARDPRLGFLGAGEDRHDTLIEALSGLGERDLARGSLQQPRAEPLLKPPNALRDHGRRIAELAPGRRHRSGGDDPREDIEIGDRLHGIGNPGRPRKRFSRRWTGKGRLPFIPEGKQSCDGDRAAFYGAGCGLYSLEIRCEKDPLGVSAPDLRFGLGRRFRCRHKEDARNDWHSVSRPGC